MNAVQWGFLGLGLVVEAICIWGIITAPPSTKRDDANR
jgi:hypothetical protein